MAYSRVLAQDGETFQALCTRLSLPYSKGDCFYLLSKPDRLSSYKGLGEGLQKDISKEKVLVIWDGTAFTTGAAARAKLTLPASGKVKPSDVPKGLELYVQSTSPNRKLSKGYVLVASGSAAPSASTTTAKRGTKRKLKSDEEDEGEEEEEEERRPAKKANLSFLGGAPTASTVQTMRDVDEEEEEGEEDEEGGGGFRDPTQIREEPLRAATQKRPAVTSYIPGTWSRIDWPLLETHLLDTENMDALGEDDYILSHWQEDFGSFCDEKVPKRYSRVVENVLAELRHSKWKTVEKIFISTRAKRNTWEPEPNVIRAQWVTEDNSARLAYMENGETSVIALEVPQSKYGIVIGVSGAHPFLFASNFSYGNSDGSTHSDNLTLEMCDPQRTILQLKAWLSDFCNDYGH